MLKIDLPFPFLGVSHQSKGTIKKPGNMCLHHKAGNHAKRASLAKFKYRSNVCRI